MPRSMIRAATQRLTIRIVRGYTEVVIDQGLNATKAGQNFTPLRQKERASSLQGLSHAFLTVGPYPKTSAAVAAPANKVKLTLNRIAST
jgi:hypothetical protein